MKTTKTRQSGVATTLSSSPYCFADSEFYWIKSERSIPGRRGYPPNKIAKSIDFNKLVTFYICSLSLFIFILIMFLKQQSSISKQNAVSF